MDWFLPGYQAGGPIRSVANIVAALSSDFEFYIVTRNTDLVGGPYKDIEPNKWLKKFDTHIFISVKRTIQKTKLKNLLAKEIIK